MCRNIRTLHNFEPPATDEEIHASALQYVRKVSGVQRPTEANREAFERAQLTRAVLDERLGLTDEEFRVEGSLVAVGPITGEEALTWLVDELESLGLSYFEDFFELEQERLLRLLWMVTGSLQEAEDIVQDAFHRLLRANLSRPGDEELRRYVFSIAGNLITDRWRRSSREREQLAQRASCSVFAIRKIESGERQPSRQLAELLALGLELPRRAVESELHLGQLELAVGFLEVLERVGRGLQAVLGRLDRLLRLARGALDLSLRDLQLDPRVLERALGLGDRLARGGPADDRSDIFQMMCAVSRAGFDKESAFSIPQPLAWLPTLRIRLEEKVLGPTVKDVIHTGRPAEWTAAAERFGEWLGRFHRAAPRPNWGKDIWAKLAHTREATARMTDAFSGRTPGLSALTIKT